MNRNSVTIDKDKLCEYIKSRVSIDDEVESLIMKECNDVEIVSRTRAAEGEFEAMAEEMVGVLWDYGLRYEVIYCGRRGFRLELCDKQYG